VEFIFLVDARSAWAEDCADERFEAREVDVDVSLDVEDALNAPFVSVEAVETTGNDGVDGLRLDKTEMETEERSRSVAAFGSFGMSAATRALTLSAATL